MTEKIKGLHQRALKLTKYAQSVWSNQREREKEDLKFQVPELQWDEDARAARRGMMLGNVPIPARPMLSVDLLKQPVQLVQNAQRQAHLGINLHPLSPEANKETAEIMQGLMREGDRNSQVELVRSWAFDRAVKSGFGCYQVTTEYDENADNPFDQVIRVRRFLDQSMVLFDPGARQPDFSDAKFCCVLEWMRIPDFEREFPKAQVPPKDQKSLLTDDQWVPEWVTGDGDAMAVCVLHFWERVCEKEMVYAFEDGSFGTDKDLEAGKVVLVLDGEEMAREREKYIVYKSEHSCVEQLDGRQKWPGKYIPIVPVFGNELQPFDNDRRYVGIIRDARDAQKGFNYAVSQTVESVALEPKAPFIVYEGQLEGYEGVWQQANTRNWPYLTVKAKGGPDGSLMPPPARAQVDGSKMQIAMNLSTMLQGAVQSVTQQYYESLGDGQTKNQSGKAIQALQQQSDTSNSHYIANLADVSIDLEARIRLDLMPVIYDRPGRIMQIVNEQEETNAVMLNAPFIPNQDGPKRVDAPPGPDGKPVMPQGAKMYDLRKGAYAVSITVGRSFQSRLQESAEQLGQILQSNPQLMPVFGDFYFKSRDIPFADQMAERMKKEMAHSMPWLLEPEEGDTPSVDDLQAQLSAKDQQIQQMQQQGQQLQQQIATDQAKQQATLQKAQMDNASKVEIEQMKAQIQILMKKMEIEAEDARTGAELVHETTENDKDKIHDLALAGQAQAHKVEQAAIGTVAPIDLNFSGANDADLGGEREY